MATRSTGNGESAVANIQAAGGLKGSLSTVQLDVTDNTSIQAATEYVAGRFGRLDVLVNNAGVSSKDLDLQTQLGKTLATNLVGPALVTETMEKLLLKSRKPYLLHVGSRYGSLALASDPSSPVYQLPLPIYSASKAALNMLMVEHSKKLGPEGVRVFAVCPGFVRSNIRGKNAAQISGNGRAGDPLVSGQLILDVIQGKRDRDVGRCIHRNGIYPW
jgi:NAD(P)-dependent dehydrogenase (short-subunit alcohol dehydrogenase family)